MDRLTSFLRESAIIVVPGVLIALVFVSVTHRTDAPTLDTFRSEYAAARQVEQVAIAKQYLNYFSASELLGQIKGGSVDGVCHLQSHAIGRAVYDRTQNFSEAIRQCGNACTYGCFHGAMMGMFATQSDTLGGVLDGDTPEAYLDSVQKIAPDLCWLPELDGVVSGRSCTHGIGHSFESLTKDLERSVRMCAVMKNKNAIDSCRQGVFMEYLFDASSSAVLLSKGSAFCDRFPNDTAACYQYKAYGWIRSWGSAHAALRACEDFGKNTDLCLEAVGRAGATEDVLATKGGVADLCSVLEGEHRSACLFGAYMKATDLNNLADSDRVCDGIDPAHTAVCERALKTFHRVTTYR